MASKDLHNNIKARRSISPRRSPLATPPHRQTIDTQGFESVEHVGIAGAITDGTFTGTVYEGDQANMSDEAAVAAAT
jgi:hypothetical protein